MNIEEDQIIDDEVIDDEVVEENTEISSDPEESPVTIQDEEEDDDDEEDRIVVIGDTDPEEEEEEEIPDETPGWVKTTRKVNKRQAKEIKQLKKQLEAKAEAEKKEEPVELGTEPTLANCSYDDKLYKEEILAYDKRKRQIDEQTAKKNKRIEEQNNAYKARQEHYVSKRKEHSFKDFSEAESTVSDTLSPTQQSIIIDGAEDSALVVYALGKNSKELGRLAKISNHVIFAFEVAKLEAQLKVKNTRTPSPEKRVSGRKSGALSGNSAKKLEQLELEADKTGDRTKVVAYKRKLRKDS